MLVHKFSADVIAADGLSRASISRHVGLLFHADLDFTMTESKYVTYVSVDLNTQEVEDELQKARYGASSRTLFIQEGVSANLMQESLKLPCVSCRVRPQEARLHSRMLPKA